MTVPLSPAGARPASNYFWAFRLGSWVLTVACWYIIAMMNLVIIGRYGPHTIEPAERFTRLIAAIFVNCLLPLIGVFLYYRKRVQRPPIHRKVLLVSAFAMVFSYLPYRGSYYSAASLTKDRIGTLAKEGAGLLPASPNQSIWDSAIRANFADIAEFSRRYNKEVGELDQSTLGGVFSAESFRDSKHMEKALTQLQALLALEQKYSSLDPIFERNKARIRSLDAPESAKEQIIAGLNNSVTQNELADRRAIYAKEEAWIRSSIDLYEFALAKRASYSLQNGKLVFKDAITMSDFNRRLKDAHGLRADALLAGETFQKHRKEYLHELNLQPWDMELPPEIERADKPN